MKRFSCSLKRKKILVRLSAPCLKAVDTLVVGVGTPQSCGLRKTALEFVRQDEPTDAGALGTRECVFMGIWASRRIGIFSRLKPCRRKTLWVQVPPRLPFLIILGRRY